MGFQITRAGPSFVLQLPSFATIVSAWIISPKSRILNVSESILVILGESTSIIGLVWKWDEIKQVASTLESDWQLMDTFEE